MSPLATSRRTMARLMILSNTTRSSTLPRRLPRKDWRRAVVSSWPLKAPYKESRTLRATQLRSPSLNGSVSRVRDPDGVNAVNDRGDGIGVLIIYAVNPDDRAWSCIPRDIDTLALAHLRANGVELILDDPAGVSAQKLNPKKKRALKEARKQPCALSSVMRASSTTCPIWK